MNKNKNSLTVLRFRQKKESRDIINKIEIKPLIIPYIGIQDDSTISHVKRIGGQILQLYSLHVMDVRTGGNDVFYYLLSNSAIFIARTFKGSPNKLINPSAS